MADLFKEIIPSILQTKKDVLQTEENVKDYTPFIVNRALSYHVDCLSYVNNMNQYAFLDKDMQYKYYLHSIRSMKRKFQPWQKLEKNDDLQAVKTYFRYSNEKAKQALRILTQQQIDSIKKLTDTGGVKN
jgi:Bacteriophage clamp loader A subunit